jgi:hypothetical protein
MTDPGAETPNKVSRARRTRRDLGILTLICLAFASPWIIGEFTSLTPSVTPSPPTLAALTAFVPQPPRDEIERQAVAAAQQGLREILQARDSSAPPPVFDAEKIRVEHPGGDVWLVSGVVSTAWQMLMASPHLYRVEVYRICHLVDPSCFKARGIAVDDQVIIASGAPATTKP